MALIERVYQDPVGILHLVLSDEAATVQPVPDDWVFVPGGVEAYFAAAHAARVDQQAEEQRAQTEFLAQQQDAQANRAAVLTALGSATGIDPAALIAALTGPPDTWMTPPAEMLSLVADPMASAQVRALGVWNPADTLTLTVSHRSDTAGLNTVYATLTIDVGLGTESEELLTLVPAGSEIREIVGATTVDLREGSASSGRQLARWQPAAGSTPAWAPVPAADNPASDVKPVSSVDRTIQDPADETVIRPTRQPRQTGRPDNAAPTV